MGKWIVVLILTLLGLVFASVGGAVTMFVGKPMLEAAKASVDWPTTEGEILESEVERSRGENGNQYSASVVYKYVLDGGELQADRIWHGGDYSTSDRSEMLKVVNQYPVGSKVTVYYDPDDPVEAVLQPGAFTSSYVLYGVGVAFAITGGVLLLIAAGVLFVIFRSRNVGAAKPSQNPFAFEDERSNDFVNRDPFSNDDES